MLDWPGKMLDLQLVRRDRGLGQLHKHQDVPTTYVNKKCCCPFFKKPFLCRYDLAHMTSAVEVAELQEEQWVSWADASDGDALALFSAVCFFTARQFSDFQGGRVKSKGEKWQPISRYIIKAHTTLLLLARLDTLRFSPSGFRPNWFQLGRHPHRGVESARGHGSLRHPRIRGRVRARDVQLLPIQRHDQPTGQAHHYWGTVVPR